MAIPNQTPYNIFTANGISTVFPYEFYLLNTFDLTVSINGAELTSGFTISGIGNVDGGEVTFLTPPANGSVILLERVVPTYRLTEYQDNGDLLAETVNKDFDRLWMAIQQAFLYLGLALTRPLLGGPFNAHGYRIENLGDPVNPQDAVTKKWFSEQNAISLARTLRVPENSVSQLPSITGRRRKLLAFNDGGDPIMVLPESGSAADVMIELAQSDGLKNIGACPDVATLRQTEPTYPNQQIYVLRHSSNSNVKLRRYYYHQADTTTADDNGRVVVTEGGKRWKMLLDDGVITPEDFGAVGDAVFSMVTNTATGTENTVALQNMFNAAARDGLVMSANPGSKYLSGSLYAYYHATLNPNWPSRGGRFRLTGGALGHATGDVENVGAAIIHKPGQTTPLLSVIGAFSIENPTGMGGYFQLERINLIGSPTTSDVLLIQGSQGSIELNDLTVKFTNPAGNGVTQKTVWDITHRNTLIRGGATGLGDWTGIGLNITSDGSDGQTNMSVYTNVECYRCGYGIRIGRRKVPTGTFGPIVFIGGQTSNSDQHGIWLDGGVIAFTSIGQQHEGAQRNGIRIDRYLEDGTPASDIPRNIKFINTYTTGCGRVDDGSGDSYAIYVVNGDGIEFDSPVFNTVGNGLVFSAGEVDNLLIRRPAFRTVRAFGASNGYGIRAFGTQDASKRQYLEHPTFNQNPATQIDTLAREIFDRGSAGGRLSFATNSTTPSISLGGQSASEAVRQLNFNYSSAVTLANITGGRAFQEIIITFSNTLVTIPNNRSTFYLNGSAFTPTSNRSILRLYFDGSAWIEISRSLN